MSDTASSESQSTPQSTTTPVAEGVTPDPKDSAPSAALFAADPATVAPIAKPATPAPEDDRIRRGFAALSRKEKALREKEKTFKDAESKLAAIETLRQKALTNPLEVLQEYGLSYEQLTDYILGNEKVAPTPEDRGAP